MPAEIAQRWDIEVVPVQVRQEDEIDAVEPRPVRDRLHPAQGPNPRPRHRVGQDPDPVEFDEDRRVAEELEGQPPGQRQLLRAASG